MLKLIFFKSMGSSKGFTLVEIMIVVAIIGILAALGVPKFMRAMDDAKSTEAVVYAGRIADSVSGYRDIHGAYPTTGAGLVEDWTSGPTTANSKDISALIPQMDISGSNNFKYTLIVPAEALDNFCIVATAVKGSSNVVGNSIYYIRDPGSPLPAQMDDSHFYRKSLFDKALVPSAFITPTNAAGCP